MIEYQFESLGPVIHILILILMILLAIAAVSLVVVMAALPGRIAKARSHPQTEAINVLGWVGLPAGIVLRRTARATSASSRSCATRPSISCN